MGRRLRSVFAALAVLACTVPVGSAPSAAADPLRLVGSQQISNRLRELRFESQALGRETSVRVLLPKDFDGNRRAGDPLPVLYLLHGCCDDYRSWTDRGQAEKLTEDFDLVVVMPDAGKGGWYSDWYNAGRGGPPAWETYHLVELRNWIEANLPVRTDRGGRSVAGLSMGGFGAMSYAARHPDLFSLAAAYSGAVDTNPGAIGQFTDYSAAMDGAPPGSIWGPRQTEEARWRAHNPPDIAANLSTVALLLRTGNGSPGGRHGGGLDVLEIGVHQAMVTLHQRLDALQIRHTWDDYGPGAHQWPYWSEGLGLTLPGVMQAASSKREPPATVSHVAYEPSYTVWDFSVVLDRPIVETSRLDIRPDGFTLTGSGRGTVTTPSRFTPGSPVEVTIAGAPMRMVADSDGRVTVAVDLGPANAQTPAGSGGRESTVEVTVSAASNDRTPLVPESSLGPDRDGELPVADIVLVAVAMVAMVGLLVVLMIWRHLHRQRDRY